MSDAGADVLKTLLTPVVPEEAQGFAVRVGVGPYPPDKPRSKARAVYAELTPVSAHAKSLLAAKNRARVLGMVPLTEAGAEAMTAEPGGAEAERASRIALQAALHIVRGS